VFASDVLVKAWDRYESRAPIETYRVCLERTGFEHEFGQPCCNSPSLKGGEQLSGNAASSGCRDDEQALQFRRIGPKPSDRAAANRFAATAGDQEDARVAHDIVLRELEKVSFRWVTCTQASI
jgi:hypothetical protein